MKFRILLLFFVAFLSLGNGTANYDLKACISCDAALLRFNNDLADETYGQALKEFMEESPEGIGFKVWNIFDKSPDTEIQTLRGQAPILKVFRDDFSANNYAVLEEFVGKELWVGTWNLLNHSQIPSQIRTNTLNLEFISNYVEYRPSEATIVRNGIIEATNKQNWIDLLKLEDIAKRSNLSKDGIIEFTILEEISWAKNLVEDIVENLTIVRNNMGEEFGRWNEIKIKVVTISDDNPFPDLHAYAANETLIYTNNSIKNNLHFNIVKIAGFETYADYLQDIARAGARNAEGIRDLVPENLLDIIHHELGHMLTTPNNGSVEFNDRFEEFVPLMRNPISENSLTKVDEAFAEIFTAYKKGESFDETLIDFFNDYAIDGYQIP